MKQKIVSYLFTTILILIGCSRENQESSNDIIEEPSTFVSQEEAIGALQDFLKAFEPETKSGKHRVIKNVYSMGGPTGTKSLDTVEDPLVYLVNFEDNEGYAVLSGDNRMQPVLVLTDNGNINQNDTITNPSTIAMLSIVDTDYRMAIGSPIELADGTILEPIGQDIDGRFIYEQDDRLIDEGSGSSPVVSYSYSSWREYTRRGTQLGCSWGQSSMPYNYYTYTSDGKKAPAGCVTAAVAQILFFWGHNFTMNGYYFDWGLMHQHTGTIHYSPAYSMVGELYLKLGLSNNLDVSYAVDGSSAYDSNVPRAFVNCGFSSGGSMQSYNFNTIYNVISSRPVYVSGKSIKKVTVKKFLGITISTTTDYEPGHAWVIDQVLTRVRDKNKYENGILTSTSQEYEHLVHCNFGWAGTDNGFYYSGHFDTNAGPETKSTTTTTYGTKYFYQYNLKMNTDIYL